MLYAILDETDRQLAQILEQVSRGEEVVVMRGTIPIAKFVPVPAGTPLPPQISLSSAEQNLTHTDDDCDAPAA